MQELNRIRGYRSMIGLSQEEMAKKIGISRENYARKESANNFNETEKLALLSVFNEKGLNLIRNDLD